METFIVDPNKIISRLKKFDYKYELDEKSLSEATKLLERTKEALARKKAEGVILGRPIGSKSSKVKLSGKELQVQKLLNKNVSYSAIGRILGVNRITVTKFAKERVLIN